jgi:hypothetical protein
VISSRSYGKETRVSLSQGSRLRHTDDDDGDGDWWLCLNPRNQASGLVAMKYVEELPPARQEKVQEQEQEHAQPPTQGQVPTQASQSPRQQRATPNPDEKNVRIARKLISESWTWPERGVW